MSLGANHDLALRAGILYLPVFLAVTFGYALPRPRQLAACLLTLLWALPALLVLQHLNLRFVWWTFAPSAPSLLAMPLEGLLGWTVLWGLVPQLALPALRLRWCLAVMVALDLLTMPLLQPVLRLGPRWLVGEAVVALLVLTPALCIARWTLNGTHLRGRAAAQVATASLVFLYLPAELVFALRPTPRSGWHTLLALPPWQRELGVLTVFLLAVPGLSAVQEFATRGRGTPLPYDPPRRLVTTGIYRYCANPMQLSCTLVMLAWAAALRTPWLLVPPFLCVVYSAGIAAWDERHDLVARFGHAFTGYRRAVPVWRLRLLPHLADTRAARLYVAHTCVPCTQLRQWLERREPLGLVLLPAESLCQPPDRLRYLSADGAESLDGLRALARALEHLQIGWALLGCTLRLPLIAQAAQALLYASGFGPRHLTPEGCPVPEPPPLHTRRIP